MPRYRVAIYGQSYAAMLELINKYNVNVLDHGSRKLNEHLYRAYAILGAAQITSIEMAGYKVERHEDVDETVKQRQAEVGTGDRYRDRRRP